MQREILFQMKKKYFVKLVICWIAVWIYGTCTMVYSQENDTLCALRGIVNISVCNIHAEADFESPMETQALLGMPVKILCKGRWYQIETPDGYVSWVHRAAIVPMDSLQMQVWLDAPKVLVTSHSSWVYSRPSSKSIPVSDVVSGCVLRMINEENTYYKVKYPDGREGFLPKKDATPWEEWLISCKKDVSSLVETALSLNGIPYLWAGTSSKGVDCSGFVQLSAFLNGMLLPRNASQQARVGTRIDCSQGFSLLHPGDLLLFGKPATLEHGEKVTHIGIYLGAGRFIHSQGYVHVNSLDPRAPDYDAFNHTRCLGAVRIADEKGIMDGLSIDKVPFYRNQFNQ